MTNLPVIQTGPEACAKCKGACCKHIPGETVPRQWMLSQEPGSQGYLAIDWDKVEEAFLSGKWVIDWWEGDPRNDSYEDGSITTAPYIRPRHSGSRVGLIDTLIFPTGSCAFLTESGCSLPEVSDPNDPTSLERPAGCTNLVAKIEEKDDGKIERHCDYPDGKHFKREAAILWIPFRERLLEAVDAAGEKIHKRKASA
jgi:hypothetical protein